MNPVLGYSSEWKLQPEEVQQCRLELLPEWETRVTEYQRTEVKLVKGWLAMLNAQWIISL